MKVDKSNPNKPIIVAIIANSIIAISKGVGYIFSGSTALLSETIHSIADVLNQSLLLIGVKRGQKGETELLNYGHSQERFFWNLLSAVGIFVLGCGVTVYHGIHQLLSKEKYLETDTSIQLIIMLILFVSLIAESFSFSVVINEIKLEAKNRNKNFFDYLNNSIDPSISAIFWEDFAAILGIAFAFIGILLTNITGDTTFDSVASILIGLLMGYIAVHLAIENKKFLIDRSIPQFEMNQILGILKENKIITSFDDIKSIVLGPERLKIRFKLNLDINILFKQDIDLLVEELKNLEVKDIQSEKLRELIKNYNKNLFIKREITLKDIEKTLTDKVSTLKHIDII